MRKLFNDEAGFVVSAELVLVLTIAVLGMVVGLASVRDSLTSEFNDISAAFGAVNQTYHLRTVSKAAGTTKGHGLVSGFGYADRSDDCDCGPIVYTDVCGKADSSTGGVANEDNATP